MNEENEMKKAFLRGYENSKRAIARIESVIHELRLMKMCPSVNNDGMPHSNCVGDLSGYMAMIDQEERKLIKARYDRMMEYQKISKCIEEVEDGLLRDVLYYRYISLMKWEWIGDKLGYSMKSVHRLHGSALKALNVDTL